MLWRVKFSSSSLPKTFSGWKVVTALVAWDPGTGLATTHISRRIVSEYSQDIGILLGFVPLLMNLRPSGRRKQLTGTLLEYSNKAVWECFIFELVVSCQNYL